MSEALVKVQRNDGYWNVSLHDPNNFGGKELTGSLFFVYGMAWGINSLSLINHFYQVASCNLCLKNILRTKSKNSLTSFSIIFFKFQAVAAIKALICMPFSPHK